MERGIGIYDLENDELVRFVPSDLDGEERARLLAGLYGATDLDRYYLVDTDDQADEGTAPPP